MIVPHENIVNENEQKDAKKETLLHENTANENEQKDSKNIPWCVKAQ